MLRNHLGYTRIAFSESVGIKESNEAELLNIRRTLSLGAALRGEKLIIESDSFNAIKWAKGLKRPPWRLITLVREIKELFVGLEVSFSQISRSPNGVAVFLAKNGVDGAIRGTFLALGS